MYTYLFLDGPIHPLNLPLRLRMMWATMNVTHVVRRVYVVQNLVDKLAAVVSQYCFRYKLVCVDGGEQPVCYRACFFAWERSAPYVLGEVVHAQ